MIFVIVYSAIGIPLMLIYFLINVFLNNVFRLIYLGQCVRAIKSLIDENGGGEWCGALALAFGSLFITGIAMDITANSAEDTVRFMTYSSLFLKLIVKPFYVFSNGIFC